MKNPLAHLVSYAEASALFAAAGRPSSQRTVYRAVTEHPALCPIVRSGFHQPRLKRRDVLKLIKFLQQKSQ